MNKLIHAEAIIAFAQCPYKAFRLLNTNHHGEPHEYTIILERKKRANQLNYIQSLIAKGKPVQPSTQKILEQGFDFLSNACLQADRYETECGLLTKIQGKSILGNHYYEPTVFIGTHKIDKYQEIELYFAAYVLEKVQGRLPSIGQIITVDGALRRMNLETAPAKLAPYLETFEEWESQKFSEQPPFILNKHCSLCQFHSLCQEKAKQEDNLSLLDRMTPKTIRKYEKKGVFTVRQLSYLFKPRKRKKRTKNPPPTTHNLELQALAIREQKTYLQSLPELERQNVELFLDIEGIPDQGLYYLLGLLISNDKEAIYHSFWADNLESEEEMWRLFWDKVTKYPNVPIYHYGSYEIKAIDRLEKRYSANGSLKERLVNVNTHVYGKTYFPVYSNRLKEIGNFIGSIWTAPNASGLQSLVWRHYWEETRDDRYRHLLLTYNEEDCRALVMLTDELTRIRFSADTLSEVNFANQPKQYFTEAGEEIHDQFDSIRKFAYSNYDKSKISFRSKQASGVIAAKKRKKTNNVRPKATKTVQVPHREFCPRHGEHPLRPTEKILSGLAVDLVLMKSGIKKIVIEYQKFPELSWIGQISPFGGAGESIF